MTPTPVRVPCPICATPIDLTITGTTGQAHLTGDTDSTVIVDVDASPLAGHLIDCMSPNLGGDSLLGRLNAAADHLATQGHTTGLHNDLRHAVTRIRLAEIAAHWALGRRDALRPPIDDAPRCDVAPPGWACTRPAGHDGPCAAWPITDRVPNREVTEP